MGSRHFSIAFPSIPPLLLLLIVLLGNEEWCEAEEQQLDYFHCASSDTPGHEKCPDGLCFDLLDIRNDQISSGCATPASSLCFSAGCSLLSDQQSFVCCCAHPFCNGKSPALIRARWRMFRKGDYPGMDGGRLKKKSARELPDEGRDKTRAGKDEEVKRRKMNDKEEDEEEPKKGMKAGVVKANYGTSEEMKKAQQGKEEMEEMRKNGQGKEEMEGMRKKAEGKGEMEEMKKKGQGMEKMEQQKRKDGEMAKRTIKAPEKKSAGGNESKASTRSTSQNGTDGMKVEEKKEKTEEGQGGGGDERIKKANEGGQEKKRDEKLGDENKMEEKKAVMKKNKEEGKGSEEGKKMDETTEMMKKKTDERALEGGTKVEAKGRTTEEKVGKEEAKGRNTAEAKAKEENKERTRNTTERTQMTTKKGASNGTEATTPITTTTTQSVKEKEGTTTAGRAKTAEKKAHNGTRTTSRTNAPTKATDGTTRTTTMTSWTTAPGKGATAATRAPQISATTTISVPIRPPWRQAIVAPPSTENKPKNETDNNRQQPMSTTQERNNKINEGQNLVKNSQQQPARPSPLIIAASSTTSGTTRSERTTRSPASSTDHQQKKKETELVPAFPWYWVALAGFACSAAVFALVYWTVRGCRRVFQKGRRATRGGGAGRGEGEEEKPEMMAQMNGGEGKDEMMGKRKKRRVPVGKKGRKEAEERNGGLGASGKMTTNESLMSQCTASTLVKGEGQNGTGTEEGAEYGGGERVTVLDPLLNQQWSGTMSK